ncbi:MAG: hypothetical protein K2L87_01295 [Clostridiales bacterium]|nr:hypothetical protein [Clostridiales bacterium]
MNKQDAIKTVTDAAKQYKENLSGKTLLYLFATSRVDADYFEVDYSEGNFLHLTGVKTQGLSPDEFFNRCLVGKLGERDFSFASDGTTQLKLDVLLQLMTKDTSARMVGKYNGINIHLHTERLAGGIKAALGFKRKENGRFVPNTLLKCDIRDKVEDPLRGLAVFRKDMSKNQYAERTYLAKGVDLSTYSLPDEVNYLKNISHIGE